VNKTNAAKWGFNSDDSTAALQGAINSGAKEVVIPYMGKPWITKPLFLASNQRIIFEPGVVVMAKQGEFHGTHDCLISGDRVNKATLRGYGATLRMRKADYMGDGYEPGEWRHALSLTGARDCTILGLTMQDSGGDGIYLGSVLTGPNRIPCQDIDITDCLCDGNHRQGMSVISARELYVGNSVFRGTKGTPPQTGIDLEPNHHDDVLQDVVISKCIAEDNYGGGFQIYFGRLNSASQDVSVRINNCLARGASHGVLAILTGDDSPSGLVEFNDCTSETERHSGLFARWRSDAPVKLRFNNCNYKQKHSRPLLSPIYLDLCGDKVNSMGGIEFVDGHVFNEPARGLVELEADPDEGDYNVIGHITNHNPHPDAPPKPDGLGWLQVTRIER
jgi:hypothetical protein